MLLLLLLLLLSSVSIKTGPKKHIQHPPSTEENDREGKGRRIRQL